ncbi:MAG: DUF805 domain-containing protein [Sphingomonadales bacterium]
MEWMLMPLRRYADFSGRSQRKEYWMFALGVFIVSLALGLIMSLGGAFAAPTDVSAMSGVSLVVLIVLVLFCLAIFIPALAVQVRRFHDQDKSGWFVLLNFIPYVGGFVVLIFMCIDGTKGPNRFGPDPKQRDVGEVFA